MTTKNQAAEPEADRVEPVEGQTTVAGGGRIGMSGLADNDPAMAPTDALTHLREADREPLTIWKVKGPKLVGGEISAILCQDVNEIVLAHTLPSGKWSLFTKVAK